jgi:Outer membrane protein beta-barrel domain
MIRHLWLLLLAGVCLTAQAQTNTADTTFSRWYVGPRVGGTWYIASSAVDALGLQVNLEIEQTGMQPQGGVLAGYQFNRWFGLQTQIFYSQVKGSASNIAGDGRYFYKTDISFLQVPLLADFRFPFPWANPQKRWMIHLAAGPYLAFPLQGRGSLYWIGTFPGIPGEFRVDIYEGPLRFGRNYLNLAPGERDQMRLMDIGLMAAPSVEYRLSRSRSLVLSGTLNVGLKNMFSPINPADQQASNSVLKDLNLRNTIYGVSVAYVFGL